MDIKELKLNALTKSEGENATLCKIAVCDTFFPRLRGMIGRQFSEDEFNAMALSPCNQIHTQFMKFPIDVVYMNKKNEVIAIEEDVQPGLFCKRVKRAHTVIELPSGAVRNYNITKGDDISIG